MPEETARRVENAQLLSRRIKEQWFVGFQDSLTFRLCPHITLKTEGILTGRKQFNNTHGVSKPFAFAITESMSRVEYMALKTWPSSVFLQSGGRQHLKDVLRRRWLIYWSSSSRFSVIGQTRKRLNETCCRNILILNSVCVAGSTEQIQGKTTFRYRYLHLCPHLKNKMLVSMKKKNLHPRKTKYRPR